MDFPQLGFVADHAYWLSGIRVRDAAANDGLGRVDAISQAFGRGDAPVEPTRDRRRASSRAALFPAFPFTEQSQAWGDAPSAPKRDRLDARR